MESMNVTFRSKIICLVHVTKGSGVIVDRGAIGRRSEISTNPANGEDKIPKPLDWAQGKSLNVNEGDGECQDLSVFDRQVNVHHGEVGQSKDHTETYVKERKYFICDNRRSKAANDEKDGLEGVAEPTLQQLNQMAANYYEAAWG